jgi:hypothetical protein
VLGLCAVQEDTEPFLSLLGPLFLLRNRKWRLAKVQMNINHDASLPRPGRPGLASGHSGSRRTSLGLPTELTWASTGVQSLLRQSL